MDRKDNTLHEAAAESVNTEVIFKEYQGCENEPVMLSNTAHSLAQIIDITEIIMALKTIQCHSSIAAADVVKSPLTVTALYWTGIRHPKSSHYKLGWGEYILTLECWQSVSGIHQPTVVYYHRYD